MNLSRYRRCPIAVAVLLILSAAVAHAEAIFKVNEPGAGSWAFDQPSVVANGTRLHVAFVGNSADSVPPFLLYYAAVEGGANFQSIVTQREDVVLTSPVAIDNGSLYTDARHPQIAIRAGNELVVLFQAVPAGSAAGDYRLFRARITVDNNAVRTQLVDEILDAGSSRMTGIPVDPSFRVVPSDNSLRVAYADASTGNVFFARVGIDNANIVGSPIPLSTLASTLGSKPLPRLQLDTNNYSHVVWAANDTADAEPTGIYYALVRANPSAPLDNLAIGATQVLYGSYRWGFPAVLVVSTGSVWVLAADQPFGFPLTAGAVGITALNPYAVIHNGQPVNVSNQPTSSSFFLSPPGGMVLPSVFDAYQPEMTLDLQNQVHVAGYGYRGGAPNFQGTPGRYYGMALGSTASAAATAALATLVYFPVSVGTGDVAFGMQTDGDYTKPAFAHFSGKAVHFWSGPDNEVPGARNLYTTSTLDSSDPTSQSGCSVVGNPRTGEAGRIPGTVVLFLPALLLLARRAARKTFGRR